MISYDDLHRAHRPRVSRLCRVLLADPDEAADTVQACEHVLHEHLAVETRPMDWGAWLTRVAVNACRDRRRSGWWRWWRERGTDDATLPSALRTPEDEVIGRETQSRVWAAIAGLPQRQREVFALRQLEGHSTADVAAMLGISAGSVKRHLFRAVARLRDVVKEHT